MVKVWNERLELVLKVGTVFFVIGIFLGGLLIYAYLSKYGIETEFLSIVSSSNILFLVSLYSFFIIAFFCLLFSFPILILWHFFSNAKLNRKSTFLRNIKKKDRAKVNSDGVIAPLKADLSIVIVNFNFIFIKVLMLNVIFYVFYIFSDIDRYVIYFIIALFFLIEFFSFYIVFSFNYGTFGKIIGWFVLLFVSVAIFAFISLILVFFIQYLSKIGFHDYVFGYLILFSVLYCLLVLLSSLSKKIYFTFLILFTYFLLMLFLTNDPVGVVKKIGLGGYYSDLVLDKEIKGYLKNKMNIKESLHIENDITSKKNSDNKVLLQGAYVIINFEDYLIVSNYQGCYKLKILKRFISAEFLKEEKTVEEVSKVKKSLKVTCE